MIVFRFLIITCCCFFHITGGSTMSQEITLDDLRSADASIRGNVEGQLRALNNNAVLISMDILRQSQGKLKRSDNREIAFRVLRSLRDPRATDALCKNIEIRCSGVSITEDHPVTLGDWYPAAGTLARIGKPAARSCLWELTKKNTAERRECFCWVVGAVEGPEVGRFVLMLAIAKETDAERKARLQEAVPVFEELFPLKQPDQRNYRPRDQRD